MTTQSSFLPPKSIKRGLHLSKSKDHEDELGSWLLPFTDMVIFLLAFFVISSTTARFSDNDIETVTESIKLAMGKGQMPDLIEPRREIVAALNQAIANIDTSFVTSIEEVTGGIEVTTGSEMLFDSGSINLKPSAVSYLKALSKELSNYPNDIVIEGHTDDIPITTDQFASNWELSTARATQVLHVLLEEGIKPSRLSATGYADTRPTQLPANLPINRRENRRVVIRLKEVPSSRSRSWLGFVNYK